MGRREFQADRAAAIQACRAAAAGGAPSASAPCAFAYFGDVRRGDDDGSIAVTFEAPGRTVEFSVVLTDVDQYPQRSAAHVFICSDDADDLGHVVQSVHTESRSLMEILRELEKKLCSFLSLPVPTDRGSSPGRAPAEVPSSDPEDAEDPESSMAEDAATESEQETDLESEMSDGVSEDFFASQGTHVPEIATESIQTLRSDLLELKELGISSCVFQRSAVGGFIIMLSVPFAWMIERQILDLATLDAWNLNEDQFLVMFVKLKALYVGDFTDIPNPTFRICVNNTGRSTYSEALRLFNIQTISDTTSVEMADESDERNPNRVEEFIMSWSLKDILDSR
ncbi:hypothetical protein HK405_012181, partial [Cladochytrium tenue]